MCSLFRVCLLSQCVIVLVRELGRIQYSLFYLSLNLSLSLPLQVSTSPPDTYYPVASPFITGPPSHTPQIFSVKSPSLSPDSSGTPPSQPYTGTDWSYPRHYDAINTEPHPCISTYTPTTAPISSVAQFQQGFLPVKQEEFGTCTGYGDYQGYGNQSSHSPGRDYVLVASNIPTPELTPESDTNDRKEDVFF